MDKPKIGRMERLSRETEPIQQFAWPGATARIDRVAEQRMADGRHMDADLMGAAGLQPKFAPRRALPPLDQDRTTVELGKRVSGSVELGVRRIRIQTNSRQLDKYHPNL